MQRINTPSAAAGHFVQGDLDNGIPPTQLSAEWFEGVQEELIGLIEHAGLTPSGDTTLVRRAVEVIVARAGVAVPAGTVIDHAGGSVPDGYVEADGGLVPLNQCPGLYAAIGNTFNAGVVPAGTFRLPDLRGRMSLGAGTGVGLSPRSVGDVGGAETHTLTAAEIPDLAVEITYGTDGNDNGGGAAWVDSIPQGSATLSGHTTGTEGRAHNNLPPFLVLRRLIKLGAADAARGSWVLP